MKREELKENCLKESATEIIYASGWGIHESATNLLECAYRMGWEGADKHPNYTDIENFSDGYHTFKELYEYRLLYNAALFNEFAKNKNIPVCKSFRHSDGELPFGGGWFIVMAQLPTGQISNHYELKDWDLFKIPELECAWVYDGHTPKDVANRLRDFLIK